MAICGPNGGHGCNGTANHRRLQLGSWLASSQRPGGGGGGAVSGYLRASSQQLLLSQQILQGFITPGTCNTRRSVERMQGSMHSHAGGVWACRRGKWAGGKCRWGRRTTGKSPRMETQNVLTCGARVFDLDACFDASSVPRVSRCLAVRSHSDPRRLHEP